jgi:DNA polymerase-3 subunit alpha
VFIKGAQEKGFNQDLASNIFDLMEKFAGYGFNKSHSAAYALLAYQTAWLKTHHASEFMAATMSSDMDKTDKVVTYIEDCRDIGIELKPPSINDGEFRFSVNEQGAVVYGLGAIKGLGEGVIELIITTRVKDGKFKDIYDFCARVDTNKLSKRAIEALIKAGAFDEIGPSESINYCRAWLSTALDDASKLADQVFKNEESGIEDLFGNSLVETSEEIKKNIPLEIEPLMTKERLEQEKSILGLYLTGHPLDEYKLELEKMRVNKLADIKNNRGTIRAAGLITDIRVMKNKKGQSFAFITLDDKYSRVEVTLWAETYAKYREYLQKDAVVLVKGEASQDRFTGRLKIIIDTVQSLYEVRCERLETLEVVIADSETDWVDLLTNRVSDYRDGNCSIKIEYHKDNSYANLLLDDSWKIDPRDELIDQLRSDFGPNNVNFEFR